MHARRLSIRIFLFLTIAFSYAAKAQPTWTLDPFGSEKKPVEYEERLLPSEKTGDKKWTWFRKLVQSNTTRYNFYFNADRLLTQVIDYAKDTHKDNYSQLLSFYPYTLENTAAQTTPLDSVIYKANAGILLHDLRSSFVDDMYLLMGKAYFLKNDIDSAALTFQFINYNLHPRKKGEDDFGRVVGSNNTAEKGTLSIANKEKKRTITKKIFTIPPARNDALVWLTRSYIEKEAFGDAAGLISILEQDRNMPKRLQDDLAQVKAYWFYSQQRWDSTATYLREALSTAQTKQDQARWEYLLAQLYEKTDAFEEASSFYNKAAKHTTSPVLEIYARLSDAKMLRQGGNLAELDKAIQRLIKMGRRDKYDGYEDAIFYAAAQLSMQRPDTANAMGLYGKGLSYYIPSSGYRNTSYVQMGDISYAQRNYVQASSFYDSLNLEAPEIKEFAADLETRREVLSRLVETISFIQKEDSLQRIALLSREERDDYIKKLGRKLRKENGQKETEVLSNGAIGLPNIGAPNTQINLFEDNNKGDWYFYNSAAKGKGFVDFKRSWGKRDNKDNWRRSAASFAAVASAGQVGNMGDPDAPEKEDKKGGDESKIANPYSTEALLAGLPFTEEAMLKSNGIIADNLILEAKIFQNELDDYPKAIETYLDYLRRFPNGDQAAEANLGLYYCYSKTGNVGLAEKYKNAVTNNFAGSKQAVMIQNPGLLQPERKNEAVTKQYAAIYNQFVEGNFKQALADKKKADSVYGTNYWTPQLLYIESIYHIKQEDDSAAILVLQDIIDLYPKEGLAEKAATMIDVLGRRKEIVAYLTNLEVTRAKEDARIVVSDNIIKPQTEKPNSTVGKKPLPTLPSAVSTIKTDSSFTAPEKYVREDFVLEPNASHYVAMVLSKVDIVYVNEAAVALKRYNSGGYYTKDLKVDKDTLDKDRALVLVGKFTDAKAAFDYYLKIKAAAPREVSWLPAEKYSFIILSENNLPVLKKNKNLPVYLMLLNANYDNKF